MLRGLLGFGKGNSPAPPKGKIEIVCPLCGAAQYESRLAISTNCRKCGEHLRIEKRRAVASSHVRPTPSTVQPPVQEEPEKPAASPAPPPSSAQPARQQAPPASRLVAAVRPKPSAPAEAAAEPKMVSLKQLLRPQADAPETKAPPESPAKVENSKTPEAPMEEMGLGELFEIAQAKPEPAPDAKSVSAEERKRTSHLPLPTPPPPVASASTLQKMKEKGVYQQQYFKDAQCFDCGHKFKVGRSSRSTNCPQCGAYISLEDVEITLNSTQEIKTRGDVIIRKNGHVSASSVQCRDLRCFGKIEANVYCSGDAIFRATGTVMGEIHCSRFVVERGSDIALMNPVYADEMEIQSKVAGRLFSRRQILITSHGSVNGDVTARSVSIEPGGELNGAMNIIRSEADMPKPLLAPPGTKDAKAS